MSSSLHYDNQWLVYNHLAGLEEFLDELLAKDLDSCRQTVLNLSPMSRGNCKEPIVSADECLYLTFKYLVAPKGYLLSEDHHAAPATTYPATTTVLRGAA